MSIKSFSPEMNGAINRKSTSLEEKILNSEAAIPHAEVKKYADYIISKLKMYKDFEGDTQDKMSFVVDALSEDRVLKGIFHEIVDGNLNKNEVEAVVSRIRKALVEELKGKIDEKIYLGIKDFVNFGQEVSVSTISGRKLPNLPEEKKKQEVRSLHNKNLIRHAIDIDNGRGVVYKNQERTVSEDYEKALQEAMGLFIKLDPHPNIVNFLENDQKNKGALYEYRKIKTLVEYASENKVDFYRSPKLFAQTLEVLKGCMEGAQYLAENNLVLQDIRPKNLGVEVEDDKVRGVLFDLEGLIKQGTIESSRMYAAGYEPPETTEDAVAVMPDEMTFQFGVSIRALMQKCVGAFMPDPGKFDISEMILKQSIVKDLKVLSENMSKKNTNDRISLLSAIAELENIIERVKNIAS